MAKVGRQPDRKYRFNPDELRFLLSLLEGYVAQKKATHDRSEVVRAQVLIGKLEGRYA